MSQGLFGWIPPSQRTVKQEKAFIEARLGMPEFKVFGKTDEDEEKFDLTELWIHKLVVDALGFAFPGIHQYTGSCFPANTPVLMGNNEEKNIQEVKEGDFVVTHNKNTKRVTQTMKRKFSGEMVTVKVKSYPFPLKMTSDHKVAVWKKNWINNEGYIDWVEAQDLEVGDELINYTHANKSEDIILDTAAIIGSKAIILNDLMEKNEAPLSNKGMAKYIIRKSGVDWKDKVKTLNAKSENLIPRYIAITPSFARLIGIYLAEGGTDDCRVVFSLNSNEEWLADEIISLISGIFGASAYKEKTPLKPNCLKVRLNNKTVSDFFENFVQGNVYTKRVPSVFLNCSEKIKSALLIGWMDGDGYKKNKLRKNTNKERVVLQGVTVSPHLAKGMASIAISCGINATICKRKARKQSKEAYDVYLGGSKAKVYFPIGKNHEVLNYSDEPEKTSNINKYGKLVKIKEIVKEKVSDLEVFDFEVEDDHSFIANGYISHNCVGAGGGTMLFTLGMLEVVRLGQPEQIKVPFWLIPYGRSRYYMGDRSPGEGSLGATFAKACLEDGFIDAMYPNVPQFKNDDGLSWYSKAEYSWSDGDAKQTLDLLPESRKHLVKTVAELKTADDVEQSIRNLYPVTTASSLIPNPNMGDDGEAYGRVARSGGHQTTFMGVWRHPKKGGRWFKYVNQWGLRWGKNGMCWLPESDVVAMIRDGQETYGFSNLEGFPAQKLPKEFFKVI